ncbi:MAG: type II toxin-antitoxin system RatA family toxin [Steroidobacteraceae bacterium]
MREVVRSAMVAVSAEKLYELINDVERYPEFVPGCRVARVEERGEGYVVATLGVQRSALNTEFTTRNELEPARRVTMRLVKGPFRFLEGVWEISPIGEQGCSVTNRLAGAMFAPLFEETAASLVDAFVRRSRQP